MRRAPGWIVAASTGLVLAFALALRSGAFPLGVRGEWEWLRLPIPVEGIDVALAGVGVAAFALFAGLGMTALRARTSIRREVMAVLALLVASIVVQAIAQSGTPVGYGLAKWMIALSQKGSSGYFTVAKDQVGDPWTFLADYPEWIRSQDTLHIGTHPPGLIMAEVVLLRTMERSPGFCRFVVEHMPESVGRAFRLFDTSIPTSQADRATLTLTGLITLIACAATVVPLYGLARASLPAPYAWATAALWPLVPSAVMFQPAADTAFPLLSTTALALAAHAGKGAEARWRLGLAGLSGLVLGVGMQFTLAFLPVGLIVAIVLLGTGVGSARDRLMAILATGAGFLVLTLAVWAITRADPFVIWWWNQRNHARFYTEFPRNYRAWLVVNPIELAIALGLPVMVWACLGRVLASPRDLPRVSMATVVVLAILTFSGKNLSEAARLWLPFMPALLVAAGSGLERFEAGPKTLAATIALIGAQTLVLEATIQVVYPI